MGLFWGGPVARKQGIVIHTPLHLLVAATAWLSRIVASSAQLLSIGLLLPVLGKTDFALYAIVVSLSGWFALSEFGLGSAIQNQISESRVLNRALPDVIRLVPRLMMKFFFYSIVLIILFSFPLQNFMFREFSKFSPQPAWLIAIVGLIYVLTALFGVAYRIFYGQGLGFISNLYQGVASVVSCLGLIYFLSIYPSITLFQALLFNAIPAFLFSLFAFLKIFSTNHKEISRLNTLSVRNVAKEEAKLLKKASKFGLFGFMAAFVLLIDYAVMSQTLNVVQIGIYNLTSKIFGFIYFIYNAILQAFWPILTEMLTNFRWKEVQIEIKKYIGIGFLIIFLGTLAIFFSQNVIFNSLAPGKKYSIPNRTLLLFGIYFAVRVWSDTYATVLQSVSELHVFWVLVPIQAIISLTAQYVLSKWFGLDGIILGLIFSFFLTVFWALPREFSRLQFKSIINTKT
jgi:O-antigen/teichoic acid export membrane protein